MFFFQISLLLGVTYRQTKCVQAILPAFMTVHAFSIPGFSKSEETKKKGIS